MARKNEGPPVVAELGRPETQQEATARKAENSRLHGQRQTLNNLVYSLLACLGMVLIIVLIVPRSEGDFAEQSVDVQTLASEASPSAGQTLVAPGMPEGWLAKQAVLKTSKTDRITQWYIGFTTPEPTEQFAAVVQAFTPDSEPANETWIAELLERQAATGVEQFDGHEWTIYSHLDASPDDTNVRYAMSTTLDNAALIVYGTDEPEVIRQLAQASLDSLK